MAGLRKVVLKILIPALILIIIVMWACLPFYWGSRKSSTPGREAVSVHVGEKAVAVQLIVGRKEFGKGADE
jgi:ABC-type glycerol-3-phosphate transport system permease component